MSKGGEEHRRVKRRLKRDERSASSSSSTGGAASAAQRPTRSDSDPSEALCERERLVSSLRGEVEMRTNWCSAALWRS
jgi:hypothetical protein